MYYCMNTYILTVPIAHTVTTKLCAFHFVGSVTWKGLPHVYPSPFYQLTNTALLRLLWVKKASEHRS